MSSCCVLCSFLFSWYSVPFLCLILSLLQIIKVCSVTILMFSYILSYTQICNTVLSESISRGSALGIKLLILIIFNPNAWLLHVKSSFRVSENTALGKVRFHVMWTQVR